jgi:serine/threonine-protein kinase
MPPDAPPICPHCGQPRPATAPAGLCPRCLLSNALGDEADAAQELPGPVLETLTAAIGPMSRVLLPDTAGHDDGVAVIRPSSPEMPALADRTSRVQLLGEMARGGMGVILKGRDNDLGRDLAVKVLLESHRNKPELVRRFVEEAQIAGQLQHPGVVPVYELGCFGDARPYFTMKLVKGRTLAQILAERTGAESDQPRLLGIFGQVAQTVAYAHAHCVIHRDLKPSNIMVGNFGEVQVMDWGLAKVLPKGGAVDDATAGHAPTPVQETVIATARSGSDSDLSRAGSVLGTPSYMAPEQARGEIEAVDQRADVFALGSILCEILTGLPAFTGRSSGEIERRASRADLASAFGRLETCGADPELADLARLCLAAEPADRPSDASVVSDRLTAHLASVQDRLRAAELARAAETARAEEASRTAAAAQAQARAERRARNLATALFASGVATAVLIASGAGWIQHQRNTRAALTARLVNDALTEATRLESEARAAVDDPGRWDAALVQARQADALVKQGVDDAFLRARVATLLATVLRKRDQAAERALRLKVDRKLLADLDAVRNRDRFTVADADQRYAEAFRAAGLDVDHTEAQAVGRWVAARSCPVELAAYLDDWVRLRRVLRKGEGRAAWTHLNTAARVADPDPWRDTLRAGVSGDFAALRPLADNERVLEAQPAVSLNLLAVYLKVIAKDQDRALKVLRIAWRQHPDDYLTNIYMAQVHAGETPKSAEERKRWEDERIRFLTAAVAAHPDGAEAYYILGNALRDAGRASEALEAYRGASRRRPDEGEAHSRIGAILLSEGQVDTALGELREAVRLTRGPVEYYYLGLALAGQGNAEEAISAYREAVRLDGAHVGQAIIQLGELLRRLGRYDEAADTFRRARELAQVEGPPAQVQRMASLLQLVSKQKELSNRLPNVLRGTDPVDVAVELGVRPTDLEQREQSAELDMVEPVEREASPVGRRAVRVRDGLSVVRAGDHDVRLHAHVVRLRC